MYRIRNFITRFRRACKWWLFIYKQPSWQEYETFIDIMVKRLLDMAKEFEDNPITMSSEQDAKRMRLAAKLLKMYQQEHYMEKYYDDGILNKNYKSFTLKWKEGYSTKSWISLNKDQKALNLAMRIIAQNMGGWWQ